MTTRDCICIRRSSSGFTLLASGVCSCCGCPGRLLLRPETQQERHRLKRSRAQQEHPTRDRSAPLLIALDLTSFIANFQTLKSVKSFELCS